MAYATPVQADNKDCCIKYKKVLYGDVINKMVTLLKMVALPNDK